MRNKIIFTYIFFILRLTSGRAQEPGIVGSISTKSILQQGNTQALVKSFDGVTNFTDAKQPDTHGAVGPNHIMSISNLGFEIFDKTGHNLSGQVSDKSFFMPLSGYGVPLRDGRLDYDPFGQRWMFIVVYAPPKAKSIGFFLAISATNDPTGAWNMWAIQTNTIDYPTLGFNKSWICVGNNRASQLYVFDKQYMYSHTSQNAPSYKIISDVSGILQPCETMDSAEANLYLIKSAAGNKGKLSVAKITGTGNDPEFTSLPDIFTGYTWDSPASISYPQLGSDTTLRCGGKDGMMNAEFINHAIWCTQAIGFFNPTRVGFQWWKIDPEQSSVLQFERIQDSTGVYYYCAPSIAVDYQNNVLLGFSIFSKTCYISAGYITHLASENQNAHDTVHFYMNGLGVYPKRGAWGDYSISDLDPVDHSFWTIQAYANSKGDWNTRWADFNLGGSMPLKSLSETETSEINIYPNPAQNNLTIDFGNHEEEYTVNVLNSKGELIDEWIALSGEVKAEMNTSHLESGIYFLQVKSKSGSRLLKFEVSR